MKFRACVIVLLVALPLRAEGQQTPRPGACAAAGTAAAGWVDFSHTGLRLALKLPPELHQLEFDALPKVSERARRKGIPGAEAGTMELVLAWQLPGKVEGPMRQLLLYSTRGVTAPDGRPCAVTIAGGPGLVFRSAQTSTNHSTDEYWIEAYWEGWVLAVSGNSAGVYEAALAVLRSVTVTP